MPPDAPLAGASTARRAALLALARSEPEAKVAAARALATSRLPIGADESLTPSDWPGRPERPRLVSPRELERRSMSSVAGRAALLHALAHIEFNAIDLALDAVARFDGLPEAFYRDWLGVAGEEAFHFTLLQDRLAALGHAYGDFPAHDGLWEMALKTRGEVLARMAIVPRTLEARGLDASPPIRAKLAQAGDHESAAILDVILRDEIGHVAIGNRWFRHLAARAGVAPLALYESLAQRYGAPRPKGPFNLAARRQAGFDDDELAALTGEPNRTSAGALVGRVGGADDDAR
ncbi:ferritin-like domain-containing protein [Chitinasiproducens palmae]|uniref:ferritin-like domain-containing protein n=1 Tax=Chitinasiproducens palmae TaxID=1770053 RepID=UPI001F229FDB|nr:ferritin-like domain-containing protein [Chitinasiproducens palmae]